MFFFQRIKKRRQNDHDNSIPMMVSQGTMTECQKPMQLNVWTQTVTDDYKSSLSLIENELRDKISKLEEKLRTHALLLNEITCKNAIKNDSTGISSSFKYKIVTEGPEIQFEPIVVECPGDEEVIYYEDVSDANINNRGNERSTAKYETLPSQHQSSLSLKPESHSSNEYTNWNGNSTVSPVSTTSSAVVLENETKYTISSLQTTASSGTLPSMFNNFRPASVQDQRDRAEEIEGGEVNKNISETFSTEMDQNNGHIINRVLNTESDYRELTNVSNSSDHSPQPNSDNNSLNRYKRENSSTSNIYTPETHMTKKEFDEHLNRTNVSNQSDYVKIGPNNTRIPLHIYESIDWSSTPIATRKLLTTIFDRITLATHSLSGKPSPAFHGRQKPSKKQLDPNAISDIVYVVTRKCNVPERIVRSAITTKCADENKMLRQRERKQRTVFDKENIVKN